MWSDLIAWYFAIGLANAMVFVSLADKLQSRPLPKGANPTLFSAILVASFILAWPCVVAIIAREFVRSKFKA